MYQDKISIEEFFKSFLEKQGASKKTQKSYLIDLREFLSFLQILKFPEGVSFSNLHVIKEQDIELYKKYLVGKQNSHSTIQRRISSLKTFFLACNKERFISHYPFNRQTQKQISHPLIHLWKEHLKQQSLPESMSDHVRDFFLWIQKKHSS